MTVPTFLCRRAMEIQKSLFIGINYIGSRKAELRGCINDVVNIKTFVVENWHFPMDEAHMKTLTDDNPLKHANSPKYH